MNTSSSSSINLFTCVMMSFYVLMFYLHLPMHLFLVVAFLFFFHTLYLYFLFYFTRLGKRREEKREKERDEAVVREGGGEGGREKGSWKEILASLVQTHFYAFMMVSPLCVMSIPYLCHYGSPMLSLFSFICLAQSSVKAWWIKRMTIISGSEFLFSLMIPVSTVIDKPVTPYETVTPRRVMVRLLSFATKATVGILCYLHPMVSLLSTTSWILTPLRYYYLLLLCYTVFSAMCDFFSILTEIISGIPVHPVFRAPFMATSPVDFWSNRWNMVVRDFCHEFIFSPMMKWLLLRRGGGSGSGSSSVGSVDKHKVASLCAMVVFFFTGAIHESLAWVVMGHEAYMPYLGYMMAFFLIHGLLCGVVTAIPRQWRNKVPLALSVASFHLIMLITCPLFFLPIHVIPQMFSVKLLE